MSMVLVTIFLYLPLKMALTNEAENYEIYKFDKRVLVDDSFTNLFIRSYGGAIKSSNYFDIFKRKCCSKNASYCLF